MTNDYCTPPTTIYRKNTLIQSSDMLGPLANIPPSKPANPIRSKKDQPLT